MFPPSSYFQNLTPPRTFVCVQDASSSSSLPLACCYAANTQKNAQWKNKKAVAGCC